MRAAGRCAAVTLALAVALAPIRSDAIAPVLLLLVKQVAKDLAQSMLRDALLSGLSGMGCKGIALSNALQALDRRGGASGIGLGALGGLPKMPSGAPSVTGMPVMPGMPAMPMGMGGAVPPEVAAQMRALMPGLGQMPAAMAMEPDQMAMLERMQQAMGEPLSPAQTIATIDEMAELGFLPKAIQAELKECMVVLPSSIPALGMGMGMLKPIIAQLRQAREQLHALSPAEQDEVVQALVQEIGPLPADQRAEFIGQLGSGFFPPRIGAGVKASLGAN